MPGVENFRLWLPASRRKLQALGPPVGSLPFLGLAVALARRLSYCNISRGRSFLALLDILLIRVLHLCFLLSPPSSPCALGPFQAALSASPGPVAHLFLFWPYMVFAGWAPGLLVLGIFLVGAQVASPCAFRGLLHLVLQCQCRCGFVLLLSSSFLQGLSLLGFLEINYRTGRSIAAQK